MSPAFADTYKKVIAADLKLSGLKKSGWGTGELQFHTCKKPSIYGDKISTNVYIIAQNLRYTK